MLGVAGATCSKEDPQHPWHNGPDGQLSMALAAAAAGRLSRMEKRESTPGASHVSGHAGLLDTHSQRGDKCVVGERGGM